METYYLVCDFGKAGRETIIDWEHCSRSDIAAAIAHGDHGGEVIEVHCIDRNDGTWRDVTEDMFREASQLRSAA